MKNNKIATLGVIVPLVVCFTFPLFGDKFVDRVEESTSVYKALIKSKDGGVPASLLEKCQLQGKEGEMESTLFRQTIRRQFWVSNWSPVLGYGLVPDDRQEHSGSDGQ